MTEQQDRIDGGGLSGSRPGAAGQGSGPDQGTGQETGRYSQQHGEPQRPESGHDGGDRGVRVLEPQAAEGLRNRWNEVQAGFVDEPRQAVTNADQLVGEVLDEVSRVFRDQRSTLERDWSEHDEPGTEDLRQALQRYREFFDRLLSL